MLENRSHALVPSKELAPAQDPSDGLGSQGRDQARTAALRCPLLSRAGQEAGWAGPRAAHGGHDAVWGTAAEGRAFVPLPGASPAPAARLRALQLFADISEDRGCGRHPSHAVLRTALTGGQLGPSPRVCPFTWQRVH